MVLSGRRDRIERRPRIFTEADQIGAHVAGCWGVVLVEAGDRVPLDLVDAVCNTGDALSRIRLSVSPSIGKRNCRLRPHPTPILILHQSDPPVGNVRVRTEWRPLHVDLESGGTAGNGVHRCGAYKGGEGHRQAVGGHGAGKQMPAVAIHEAAGVVAHTELATCCCGGNPNPVKSHQLPRGHRRRRRAHTLRAPDPRHPRSHGGLRTSRFQRRQRRVHHLDALPRRGGGGQAQGHGGGGGEPEAGDGDAEGGVAGDGGGGHGRDPGAGGAGVPITLGAVRVHGKGLTHGEADPDVSSVSLVLSPLPGSAPLVRGVQAQLLAVARTRYTLLQCDDVSIDVNPHATPCLEPSHRKIRAGVSWDLLKFVVVVGVVEFQSPGLGEPGGRDL
mmetsp:Transcript_933/g.2293  ORF Transcript_933/g.2293 Transcript_933/m.2293 type:complete len:387 (+) Transcript_933:2155-3315(+)